MANLKTSQLNVAEPLDGAELIGCVQSGNNVRTTAQAIAALNAIDMQAALTSQAVSLITTQTLIVTHVAFA